MRHPFKSRPEWIYSLASGGFIYLFLKLFQPFGFGELDPQRLEPLLLGYALIGFLMILLNHIVLGPLIHRRFPDIDHLFRRTLWPLWIVLTIVLANICYTRWYFVHTGIASPGRVNIPAVISGTLALGILCVVLIDLVEQNLRLRRNLRFEARVNRRLKARLTAAKPDFDRSETSRVRLVAENGKDVLTLPLARILFLAAEENYVAVHHLEEKSQRVLIRSSLTRIERQVRPFHPLLFRCHRGYIVNIQAIASVSGNAQGFQLRFEQTDTTVPVSRRYMGEFRRVLDRNL